jgi:AraC-like DNA-binding protein
MARHTCNRLDSTPIGPSPIENVLICARLGPAETGFKFKANSLPGHLIHCIVKGRVRQDCNGREYELTPGSVIWYHEDELVRGTVLEGPWDWYTVNFIAPTFPPPSFESRMFFPRGDAVLAPFKAMLAAWEDQALAPYLRLFQVHANLLRILAALTTPAQHPARMDPRARLWWTIETELRNDLQQRIDLARMSQVSGRSQATIARSCMFAVGIPPLKRIKQVRMSLAQGLVLRSSLSISDIADRVGYARIHEFSRDYRKYFGVPPTRTRAKAPSS